MTGLLVERSLRIAIHDANLVPDGLSRNGGAWPHATTRITALGNQ